MLEDLVHALQSRQSEVSELLTAARDMGTSLDALKGTTEKVLQAVLSGATGHGAGIAGSKNGTAASTCEKNGKGEPATEQNWTKSILSYLQRWQASRTSEDCPLPELFKNACQAAPGLTIGQFHDGLRRLYDQQQIYLHPWTGPLYEVPEPPYALLVGHEIAYYASLR